MPKTRPSIAIVGAGNLARVLAVCLDRAGYRIDEVIARSETASRRRARRIAKMVNARAVSYEDAALTSPLVWICVTDDFVATTARLLARRGTWRNKTVFHSSGALPSSVMAPLKRAGAKIASVHPMNTFVAGSKLSLEGTPFSVEGDPGAVRLGERIARDLSHTGYIFRIKPESKILYHAMGSFASPLFIALLAVAENVGRTAGIKQPQRVIGGILRRTMENYLANGTHAAFSGPINRGDVTTVRKHLRTLRRVRGASDLYRTLAKIAVNRFPVKNRQELKKLLK